MTPPDAVNDRDEPRSCDEASSDAVGRAGRLVIAVVLIGVLWLVVLPWLSSLPTMSRHVRWLDDRGVDPGAMYYTELDAMAPILERLNRRPRSRD